MYWFFEHDFLQSVYVLFFTSWTFKSNIANSARFVNGVWQEQIFKVNVFFVNKMVIYGVFFQNMCSKKMETAQ